MLKILMIWIEKFAENRQFLRNSFSHRVCPVS